MPRESKKRRTERAGEIVAALKQHYPVAECALNHRSALQLLVATILSAQCTDERVNMVTPTLFKRYKTAKAYANAEPAELKEIIRSTGFFNNKAKNLIAMGETLERDYGGGVPDDMNALLTVPGVARKTANVVLGTWFGKNVGVVVDTHVGRLATRLKLAPSSKDSKDAVRIERDLQAVVDQADWTYLSHALIWHGRGTCSARSPQCDECILASLCPSAGKV